MKILIYGKREFNNFMQFSNITDDNVEERDILIISINTPRDTGWFTNRYANDVHSHFKRNHSNVLIEHFPDFGENMARQMREQGVYSVFSERKAKRIYEFIKRNKNKSLAVIHCGAGVSRSGAVGAFLFDMYGHESMTWDEFQEKNPKIQPNMHVLRLLHEQLRKDPTPN